MDRPAHGRRRRRWGVRTKKRPGPNHRSAPESRVRTKAGSKPNTLPENRTKEPDTRTNGGGPTLMGEPNRTRSATKVTDRTETASDRTGIHGSKPESEPNTSPDRTKSPAQNQKPNRRQRLVPNQKGGVRGSRTHGSADGELRRPRPTGTEASGSGDEVAAALVRVVDPPTVLVLAELSHQYSPGRQGRQGSRRPE
jgi:hypothetical protein